MQHFQNYRWPGNIRELENVIERIVVLSREDEITVEDLPDFLGQEHVSVDTLQLNLPPQGVSLEAVEKELIERALNKFHWNQTHTARFLDISRKALMYRMEKHGIHRPGQQNTPVDGELERRKPSSPKGHTGVLLGLRSVAFHVRNQPYPTRQTIGTVRALLISELTTAQPIRRSARWVEEGDTRTPGEPVRG